MPHVGPSNVSSRMCYQSLSSYHRILIPKYNAVTNQRHSYAFMGEVIWVQFLSILPKYIRVYRSSESAYNDGLSKEQSLAYRRHDKKYIL